MQELLSRLVIDSRRLLYFYQVGEERQPQPSRGGPAGAPAGHQQGTSASSRMNSARNCSTAMVRGVTLTPIGRDPLWECWKNPAGNGRDHRGASIWPSAARMAGSVSPPPATVMSLYMPEVIKRFRAELPDTELVAMQAFDRGNLREADIQPGFDLGLVQEILNFSRFEAHKLLVEPMVGDRGQRPSAGRGWNGDEEKSSPNTIWSYRLTRMACAS